MHNNSLEKYSWSFGISVILTSIFSALLVVVKETNQDTVLAWMKSLGHHWAIHGVLNVIVFLFIGLALANTRAPDEAQSVALGRKLILTIIGCTVVIAGFYLLEG